MIIAYLGKPKAGWQESEECNRLDLYLHNNKKIFE